MAERAHTTSGGTSLPLTLIDLEQHPDGELLRMIARATVLREREWLDRLPPAKHLGKEKRRDYNQLCHDLWKLDMAIASHPATTRFGVHAKALYAVEHRDFEAKAPTCSGLGLVFSVLSDALRTGALS